MTTKSRVTDIWLLAKEYPDKEGDKLSESIRFGVLSRRPKPNIGYIKNTMRNIGSITCLVLLGVAVSAYQESPPRGNRLRRARSTSNLGRLCNHDFIKMWVRVCHGGAAQRQIGSDRGKRQIHRPIEGNFNLYSPSFTSKLQMITFFGSLCAIQITKLYFIVLYDSAMEADSLPRQQSQMSTPFHRPPFGHRRRRKRSLDIPMVKRASRSINLHSRLEVVAMICCRSGCTVRHIRSVCL